MVLIPSVYVYIHLVDFYGKCLVNIPDMDVLMGYSCIFPGNKQFFLIRRSFVLGLCGHYKRVIHSTLMNIQEPSWEDSRYKK